MVPERRAPSLGRRFAIASAGAAILGGTVAALGAGVASGRLMDADREAAVLHQARVLAGEVGDELAEDGGELETVDSDDIEDELEDELEDIPLPRARAALHLEGRRIAGDAALPRQPVGRCMVEDGAHPPLLVCSVALEDAVLTLASEVPRFHEERRLLSWAALIGILCGALGGAVAGAALGRWAVSPLRQLRDRVRRVEPDAPSSAPIGEAMAFAEIEELRRTLVGLLDRLSAALAQAQRFAVDAAHELRTPLTTLRGELDMMAEGGFDEGSVARARDKVTELGTLVERLLALATPAEGATFPREAVDLGDVARDAGQAAPRIALELEDDVLVRGDPTLLRAAIKNGIDNALKFSEGRVTLRVFERHGEAVVEIADDGPGIPLAERERVFLPFYRTPTARSSAAGGHGIGLALVAHVARGHRGRAELADVARGTCLRIVLPVWSQSSSSPSSSSPSPSSSSSPPSSSSS